MWREKRKLAEDGLWAATVGNPSRRAEGFTRITLAVARAMIAGGVKHRSHYGFRQHPDLERWASVLGGIGTWANADTSRFNNLYAETLTYMYRHLVGENVDSFCDRKDIRFLWRDGEGSDTGFEQILPQDWVEPTWEDIDGWFQTVERSALRNSKSYISLREGLSAMGLPITDRFELYADAFLASLLAVSEYGRPPLPDVNDEPSSVVSEIFYYYTLIMTEYFELDQQAGEWSGDPANLIAAGFYMLSADEAEARGKLPAPDFADRCRKLAILFGEVETFEAGPDLYLELSNQIAGPDSITPQGQSTAISTQEPGEVKT